MPGDVAHVLAGYFPEVKSARGQNNLFYQQRAIHALTNDPRFDWIMGGSYEDIMAGRAIMRRTILQALGRIDDDGALREVAEEICRIKPTARHVAAIVRDYRGVKRSPDVLALANKIIADINDYAYRYPEVSTDDMKSALCIALADVGKLCKEPKPRQKITVDREPDPAEALPSAKGRKLRAKKTK